MSLINEALKRAKEAQNEPQAKAQAQAQRAMVSEPAMQPVESRTQHTASTVYLLCAALAVVLVGAVALLWMWSNSQKATVAQTVSTPTVQPAAISPAPSQAAAIPVAKIPEQPLVPVTETVAAAPVVAEVVKSEPVPVAVPEPVVPAVPQFPVLKLQGIFYNAAKPAAVLNGKTYYVGGVVSGAKITKIEADTVTVEWNGETKVLETAQ